MSTEAVERWLTALRSLSPEVGLSPEGARAALEGSLGALAAVSAQAGPAAPDHTVIVCASTVFTAPLEWAAVLLSRGGRVTLKAPRALEDWFAQVASSTELPLVSTTERSVLDDADLIVAMGSDATLAQIRNGLRSDQRLLGFGHRFSVAWWEDPSRAADLARDLALYDGRGCMSPIAVFSPLPDAAQRLAGAMERMEARMPRGALRPGEGAAIRLQTARARVRGVVHCDASANRTPTWAVCSLPAEDFEPRGLPRIAFLHPSDWEGFLERMAPHAHRLSTVGTDRPITLGTARTCALGSMQTPPLERLHDGVDWLAALVATDL